MTYFSVVPGGVEISHSKSNPCLYVFMPFLFVQLCVSSLRKTFNTLHSEKLHAFISQTLFENESPKGY